jgi:hypothetical protein
MCRSPRSRGFGCTGPARGQHHVEHLHVMPGALGPRPCGALPEHHGFVGRRMGVDRGGQPLLGVGEVKAGRARAVPRPQYEHHRRIDDVDLGSAEHVEKCPAGTYVVDREILGANVRVRVVECQLPRPGQRAGGRVAAREPRGLGVDDAVFAVVKACGGVQLELRCRPDRMLNGRREERHVPGTEPHPLAPYERLAVALQGQHRLLGHAVAVHVHLLAWRQRQHVQAFRLKSRAGPGDQPRAHPWISISTPSLSEPIAPPVLISAAVRCRARYGSL